MEVQKLESSTLLAYLRKKYDEALAEKASENPAPPKTSKVYRAWIASKDSKKVVLDNFCAFAQEFLNKYKPTQTSFLDMGIGLVLGDGQPVALCDSPDNSPMYDEGIHITRPRSLFGRGGMQDVSGVSLNK